MRAEDTRWAQRWAKRWVLYGNNPRMRLQCQQRGGGVMVWIGIIRDRFIGQRKVPDVKINAITCCNYARDVLTEISGEPLLSEISNIIFMNGKVPPHAVKRTQEVFLFGIQKKMFYGVARLLSRCKSHRESLDHRQTWDHKNGRQYASMGTHWKAIQVFAKAVLHSNIKTLTGSSNNCIFKDIKNASCTKR